MITKSVMLIFVSATGNNNKFYEMKLLDTGRIDVRYGRVGTKGASITKHGGERGFQSLYNAKTKKGYTELEVIPETISTGSEEKRALSDIVLEQIEADTESIDLVKKLIEKNVHSITQHTAINFDTKTGLFSTPLGPITLKGLKKASKILNKIEKKLNSLKKAPLDSSPFIDLNVEYFKLIPTKIKNTRDHSKYMLLTEDRITTQRDIIESLEGTIELIETDLEDQKDKKKEKKDDTIYFNTKVNLLKDKKEFKRINDLFEKSKNSVHGHRGNTSKIKKIYSISIGEDDANFDDTRDNIWELWHGTKVVNLLSILKSGLLMPDQSPGDMTGYMFGKGLYFSDQSTKALNYCDGMYWRGSSSSDSKIYMFLSDIGMGNYMVPSGSRSSLPPAGYDSYFAKGRESGVQNNEMIVFKKDQIKLKYILEIEVS